MPQWARELHGAGVLSRQIGEGRGDIALAVACQLADALDAADPHHPRAGADAPQ